MAPSRRTRSAYFAVKQEFREEENALQSPTPLTCVAGAARPSVIKTEAATSAVTVESSTLASDTPTTAVACAAIPAAVDARSSSVPQQGEGQARRTPAEGDHMIQRKDAWTVNSTCTCLRSILPISNALCAMSNLVAAISSCTVGATASSEPSLRP